MNADPIDNEQLAEWQSLWQKSQDSEGFLGGELSDADAEFFDAAVEAFPLLLAEVERLKALNEKYLSRLGSAYDGP